MLAVGSIQKKEREQLVNKIWITNKTSPYLGMVNIRDRVLIP